MVSLKAYSRGQVSENDLRNIAQPLGQIHAARILMRKWSVLPDQEFKVISVIFGAMTAWGKETRKFTYRFLEFGDAEHAGTGHGKRNLMRIIASLEERRVILVDRSDLQTGLDITINFQWTPDVCRIAVPKGLRNGTNPVAVTAEDMDRWAETSDTAVTTPMTEQSPPPCQNSHPFKARLLKQDFSKQEGLGPASLPLDTAPHSASLKFDPASGWDSEPAARPKGFSSTPIAPSPSFTTSESLMAPVAASDRKLRDKAEKVLKPVSLEVTFRREFADRFKNQPGAVFPVWTPKDMGMVKNIFIKRWAGTVEEAHAFVRWSVGNWQAMMSRPCFVWMKRDRAPEFPQLGFWLAHHANFLVERGRETTDRWIADMQDFEEREFGRLTIKQGMSDEAARMRIAEDRATRKMREENAKAKKQADTAWQKAAIVERNIKRMGSRQVVHPDSITAREARKAEEDARAEAYRREHNIQPLSENDPVPDLIAAADIGWQNAGYDKG